VSFSFTDPKPNRDDRSFRFTEPDAEDVEQKLQAITDLAHEILRQVADLRRQLTN